LNNIFAAAIVSACLFGVVLLGMGLRRLLPADHLSDDAKDTVKLAIQVSSEPMFNVLSHLAK
jgi:hypothetical protein